MHSGGTVESDDRKIFRMAGVSGNTEGSWANSISEEVIEGFVVDTQISMNFEEIEKDWVGWTEPLTLVIKDRAKPMRGSIGLGESGDAL